VCLHAEVDARGGANTPLMAQSPTHPPTHPPSTHAHRPHSWVNPCVRLVQHVVRAWSTGAWLPVGLCSHRGVPAEAEAHRALWERTAHHKPCCACSRPATPLATTTTHTPPPKHTHTHHTARVRTNTHGAHAHTHSRTHACACTRTRMRARKLLCRRGACTYVGWSAGSRTSYSLCWTAWWRTGQCRALCRWVQWPQAWGLNMRELAVMKSWMHGSALAPFLPVLSLTHTRTNTYTRTHAHTCTHAHTRTHARTHAHARTHTQTHTHARTRAHARTAPARGGADAGPRGPLLHQHEAQEQPQGQVRARMHVTRSMCLLQFKTSA